MAAPVAVPSGADMVLAGNGMVDRGVIRHPGTFLAV